MANLLAVICLLQTVRRRTIATDYLPQTELFNRLSKMSFALDRRRLGTHSLGNPFALLPGSVVARSICYRIPSRRSVSFLRIVLPLTNWLGTKLF